MRKIALSFLVILLLSLVSYTALGFYTLQSSNIETNASCAIGDSGTYLPRSACLQYLGHQLDQNDQSGEAQRVLHLAIGAYPTHPDTAREVMDIALSHGAGINEVSPISGYPPLHEAVLLNEPSLAEFLMERGANPEIEDQNNGLSAIELLSAIKERNPDQNMAEIEARIR